MSITVTLQIIKVGVKQPAHKSKMPNIHAADLQDWVEVHQGSADEISRSWQRPIDLLFLDGDQSPQGARLAYESWFPMLKTQ